MKPIERTPAKILLATLIIPVMFSFGCNEYKEAKSRLEDVQSLLRQGAANPEKYKEAMDKGESAYKFAAGLSDKELGKLKDAGYSLEDFANALYSAKQGHWDATLSRVESIIQDIDAKMANNDFDEAKAAAVKAQSEVRDLKRPDPVIYPDGNSRAVEDTLTNPSSGLVASNGRINTGAFQDRITAAAAGETSQFAAGLQSKYDALKRKLGGAAGQPFDQAVVSPNGQPGTYTQVMTEAQAIISEANKRGVSLPEGANFAGLIQDANAGRKIAFEKGTHEQLTKVNTLVGQLSGNLAADRQKVQEAFDRINNVRTMANDFGYDVPASVDQGFGAAIGKLGGSYDDLLEKEIRSLATGGPFNADRDAKYKAVQADANAFANLIGQYNVPGIDAGRYTQLGQIAMQARARHASQGIINEKIFGIRNGDGFLAQGGRRNAESALDAYRKTHATATQNMTNGTGDNNFQKYEGLESEPYLWQDVQGAANARLEERPIKALELEKQMDNYFKAQTYLIDLKARHEQWITQGSQGNFNDWYGTNYGNDYDQYGVSWYDTGSPFWWSQPSKWARDRAEIATVENDIAELGNQLQTTLGKVNSNDLRDAYNRMDRKFRLAKQEVEQGGTMQYRSMFDYWYGAGQNSNQHVRDYYAARQDVTRYTADIVSTPHDPGPLPATVYDPATGNVVAPNTSDTINVDDLFNSN